MATEPMRPVMVGVDGSVASMAAVDLAAEEAVGRVAPLLVVHAHTGYDGPSGHEQPDAPHRILALAEARARSEHPGLSVTGELAYGDPAELLVRRSTGACLLVVGHRGRYAPARRPVGSVTIHVASRSEVPVMVHRPLDTSMPVLQPRPVLIGIGPGSGCEPVVEFGFVEADLRGAPLLAIHVWSGAVDAGEIERMFDEALFAWSDKYPQVAVRRMVRYGLDVAVSLTAAARSAQLVVVGSSRRTRTGSLLAGSVGQALIRRASCPVAVLPAH